MRRYPPRPARNPNGSWSPGRDRAAQARFRAAVLEHAGYQCQYTDESHRCLATLGLQAHHTQPGNDDPGTGLALCRLHHRALDPHAR